MAKIKYNTQRMSVSDKINKGASITGKTSGNSMFNPLSAPIQVLTERTDALKTASVEAESARKFSMEKTSALADREHEWDIAYTQMGNEVESLAAGNATTIEAAGYDTRTPKTVSGVPVAPRNLSATYGDRAGEVDLSWDSVQFADKYYCEYATDNLPETIWKKGGYTPKSKKTITGLTSGTKYYFRVTAIGPKGDSGPCDAVVKYAP